jgi:hypothetical protein
MPMLWYSLGGETESHKNVARIFACSYYNNVVMVFLQTHLNILINQNQNFQTMTKNVGLFIGDCN